MLYEVITEMLDREQQLNLDRLRQAAGELLQVVGESGAEAGAAWLTLSPGSGPPDGESGRIVIRNNFV